MSQAHHRKNGWLLWPYKEFMSRNCIKRLGAILGRLKWNAVASDNKPFVIDGDFIGYVTLWDPDVFAPFHHVYGINGNSSSWRRGCTARRTYLFSNGAVPRVF
jgi:hypothetical protein